MSTKFRNSLKILTHISYIFGVLLVLSATLLSVVNFPVSAEWNKGSLSFRGSCGGNCTVIKVQICNDGSGDMDQPTAFEVYHTVSGDPKSGSIVGGGTVPALPSGQCASLEYNPNGVAGTYIFKAYQPAEHPGQGVLWSGSCSIGPCRVPTNTPVTPTNTPVTPTPQDPTPTAVTPTNTPMTPTPQDPTPTSVTPTNTPVTPTPQDPTPTSVTPTNTPVTPTPQDPTPTSVTPTNTPVTPTPQDPTPTSVTPTNTPVTPTPQDPTPTSVTPTNTPVTPTPQDPTPTSVTPTNTPVTPTPQDPTPTSINPTNTPVTENTPQATITKVSTLPPPVVKDTPSVLIPVTGADFSSTNGGNATQKITFNLGLGLIGFGMVLHGFRKRFHL